MQVTDDTVFLLKTVQSSQFKTLFDSLKDVITECNVTIDVDKMTIVCLDPGRVALVYCAISTVEFYYCREKTIIGINVSHLHRMMRSMNSGDLLEWSILKSNPHVMNITIVNSDKRTQTKNSLKLLVLDEETIEVPAVAFDRVVSLPSSDLSRYVRELASISNIITVRGSDSTLELIAEGDSGSSHIIIEPTAAGMNWLHASPEGSVVEGRFYAKYMEKFIRSQLDSSVELFLKSEYPLVLRFEIAIGTIRFCIAPTTE
ncbi:unnamed protein product [Phaeothamnion confervicola]